MLRTSSYTIYVDLPGNDEEMLLVQTYTGAFDRVSRRVATYVRSLEAGRPPKPLYGDWTPEPASVDEAGESATPADETIDVLRRRGYLTPMSREEEETFFIQYVEKLHGLHLRRWPSYLFMPTYDCNLRCGYCFQDHMRTDPRFGHLLRQMTPDMVDRVFAAMPKIEALHGLPVDATPQIDIGFFGGEPLLAANRPIVEQILRRGRERGEARFWAISNGTELDAYEDLLGPGLLASIQITLDGPPAEHDRRRVHADGRGSWEAIARNVTMALDRGVQVAIRTNADRTNLGGLAELAGEIVAHGWDRSPNFSSQVAPIRASNGKTDSGTTLDTWQLDRHLTEMRQADPRLQVLGRLDDTLRQQARRIFSRRGLPAFKPSFCSAHTGMYIFDPFGDIYACWEKTGDEKVRIGHVEEDSEVRFNFDLQALWQGRTVASNPVCLKCRYNLFCGGGGAVLDAGHSGGDFYRNYCDGFAHRFRASVAEAYIDHADGKAFVDGSPAYAEPGRVRSFLDTLLREVQGRPGVRSAGVVTSLPLKEGGNMSTGLRLIANAPLSWQIDLNGVSPRTFSTLGIPLLRGRDFTPAETGDDQHPVVILNATAARRLWPAEEAVGKPVILDWMNPVPRQVVGVVGDLREVGPDTAPHPEAFLPYPQIFFGSAHLVIHTAGDPRGMAGEVRRLILGLDSSLPLGDATTLEQLAAARVANPATDARILAAFAATGLILAVIGVYGVTSFAVAQQRWELGVRIALGAQNRDVVRAVLARGLPWIVLGLLLGLSGGAFLSRLLASTLFEVSPLDPWTFAVMPLLLLAVALWAGYVPARRAALLDPLRALTEG